MGQVRHGSATTTHAVRAAIQRSQASLSQLSRELGINPKTVAKWRKRVTVEDMKTGPKEPRSTVLTEAEEATAVAFRRHTLLPLDDCLYALQPSIPHLTRSAPTPSVSSPSPCFVADQPALGSGLIDHIQKMTIAAMAIADMKVWAQRS
jgi:hypothetical protein